MQDSGVITTHHLQKMSQEQLKGFLEAVQADVILQEKLRAISSTNGEDQSVNIIAVAKHAGFIISAEDLKSLRTEIELEDNDGAELTDEQLEAVAGGALSTSEKLAVAGLGLLILSKAVQ